MKTNIKLPAFLASAIVNGDLSGFDTDEDAALYEAALKYIGEGHVVDVGESYFSHGCDLPGVRFIGEVADYTVIYDEATPTPPRPAPVSFKVEVIADSSGKFCSNGCRYATREAAEKAGKSLAMRWTLVREWRVAESDEPVTEKE